MSTTSSKPSQSRQRASASPQFGEQCKPLPAQPGETLEERVDRLDRSIDYLSGCFRDEFEVRGEASLLIDIFSRILLPFAALSTAISLAYVRIVEWSSINFPSFERVAAFVYLALLLTTLGILIVARRKGWPRWVDRQIDQTVDTVVASVPARKETLTRNNLVNEWIYIWVIGAVTLFIPLTFIALRSDVGDRLGVQLMIDTANVCEGSGRIGIFTGSDTCVAIQEDNANMNAATEASAAIGDAATALINPVERLSDATDTRVAEIRLDMTTTLALAVILLVIGILASMALWWWRNRRVRKIAVL